MFWVFIPLLNKGVRAIWYRIFRCSGIIVAELISERLRLEIIRGWGNSKRNINLFNGPSGVLENSGRVGRMTPAHIQEAFSFPR